MTIKEMMKAAGMNMKKVSERFNIPYRTLQNWCARTDTKNYHECPQYIVDMMAEILGVKEND